MNPQLLLACGSPVAAALPRRWAEALAQAAGDMAWHCAPAARAVVYANLEKALGAPAPEPIRREVFRNYARYYLGLMRLAHNSAARAVGEVELRGAEHVHATLARGRGALLLGAHLGNWDVAGLALARCFGGLHTYAEPLRPASLLRFYTRVRARHGVQALCVGSPTRVPFDVLRRNRVLGLLVDRPFGRRHVRVPFGSGRLLVPTGGIRLGLRAGAGIHVFSARRQTTGHVVEVGPELDVSAGGPEHERIRAIATAFAAALREVVARHPEQWCLLASLSPLSAAAPDGGQA